jgi:hypothetical protein
MRHCALLAGLAVFMLTGCAASPRVVSATPAGGIVAIPNNSNAWPSYHRTKALELIAKQCPRGYQIDREEEVVIGQTTTNSTQQDTKEIPIAKGLAVDVRQTTHNTTEVRDRTEYRIWYSKLEK